MIVDTINNLAKYAVLHPLIGEVARVLSLDKPERLQPGRVVFQEGRFYANIEQTLPKRQEEARLEAHRRFIDVQIPLTGTEVIGYTPTSACTDVSMPYDEKRDLIFYGDSIQTYLTIKPGMFAIFFPEDAHAPGITPTGVRKVVAKIRID